MPASRGKIQRLYTEMCLRSLGIEVTFLIMIIFNAKLSVLISWAVPGKNKNERIYIDHFLLLVTLSSSWPKSAIKILERKNRKTSSPKKIRKGCI